MGHASGILGTIFGCWGPSKDMKFAVFGVKAIELTLLSGIVLTEGGFMNSNLEA